MNNGKTWVAAMMAAAVSAMGAAAFANSHAATTVTVCAMGSDPIAYPARCMCPCAPVKCSVASVVRLRRMRFTQRHEIDLYCKIFSLGRGKVENHS